VLVEYFCMLLWVQVCDKSGKGSVDELDLQGFFEESDINHDGQLSKEELVLVLQGRLHEGASAIVAQQMMEVLGSGGESGSGLDLTKIERGLANHGMYHRGSQGGDQSDGVAKVTHLHTAGTAGGSSADGAGGSGSSADGAGGSGSSVDGAGGSGSSADGAGGSGSSADGAEG
jgi:hypothetical protein